jgi:hypothetical protein
MSVPSRFATCTALALTLVLSSVPDPAFADKGGGKVEHGHGHGKPDKVVKESQEHFNNGQFGGGAADMDPSSLLAAGATSALVSALLGGQTQHLAVGAKPLPPGIQKNLARGKPLPPGIAKQRLPSSLSARLPVVDGHDWIRIGTELVLIGIATNVVAQVIHNVFS